MSILRNATAVQVPALSAEPKVMGSKREEETHTAPCHQCLTARDMHAGRKARLGRREELDERHRESEKVTETPAR